jgi:hypothetical protein
MNFEVPEHENCSPNYFSLDSKMHLSTILRTVKNVSICIPKPSVLTYSPSEANGCVCLTTDRHTGTPPYMLVPFSYTLTHVT